MLMNMCAWGHATCAHTDYYELKVVAVWVGEPHSSSVSKAEIPWEQILLSEKCRVGEGVLMMLGKGRWDHLRLHLYYLCIARKETIRILPLEHGKHSVQSRNAF